MNKSEDGATNNASEKEVIEALDKKDRKINNNECEIAPFTMESANIGGSIVYVTWWDTGEFKVTKNINRDFGYVTKNDPLDMGNGLSDDIIRKIIDNQKKVINSIKPRKLYWEVYEIVKKFNWREEEDDYHVITAAILYTYFFDVWNCAPYMLFWGSTEQGKTQLLDTFELLGYRSFGGSSPSGASLYRSINDNRGLLCIDEAENLVQSRTDRWEDVRSIVKGGFNKGSKVPRCNMVGNKINIYDTFCPKAFASTELATSILGNRCIVFNMIRNINGVKYPKPPKTPEEPYISIRDRLILCRLKFWKKMKEKPAPKIMKDMDDSRVGDLVKPLICIANLFNENSVKIVVNRLKEMMEFYKEIPRDDDVTHLLIALAKNYNHMDHKNCTIEEITDFMNIEKFGGKYEEAYKYKQSELCTKVHVGRLLSSLGFKKKSVREESSKTSVKLWRMSSRKIALSLMANRIDFLTWFSPEKMAAFKHNGLVEFGFEDEI